jgi:UDP-N-acetylglucosamine transferase subunit ALG13
MDLLVTLASRILDGSEPVWVTSRTQRGEALLRLHESVVMLPEFGRSPLKLLANVWASIRLVARERPRTVVTSGAGVVAPFCVVARLAGARVIFIETMARVSSPSLTGRLLARIASRVLVQWPELRSILPRATLCRPALLERLPEDAQPPPGRGTFVAVGTDSRPYVRLLDMVQRAVEDGRLPGPVLAQVGSAEWAPDGVEAVPFLERERVEEALADADVVVCHAGAGIISSALASGRRPLVLPRLADLGEHVDDHQLQIARKLAEWGLVVLLEDEIRDSDLVSAREPLRVPDELEAAPSAAELLREELSLPPVAAATR